MWGLLICTNFLIHSYLLDYIKYHRNIHMTKTSYRRISNNNSEVDAELRWVWLHGKQVQASDDSKCIKGFNGWRN